MRHECLLIHNSCYLDVLVHERAQTVELVDHGLRALLHIPLCLVVALFDAVRGDLGTVFKLLYDRVPSPSVPSFVIPGNQKISLEIESRFVISVEITIS